MAVTLAEADSAALSLRLNRLREQADVGEAALFDQRGNVLAFAASTLAAMRPEPVAVAAIRRARMQQSTTSLDSKAEQGLVLRAVEPVNLGNSDDPLRVLQLMQPVPKQLRNTQTSSRRTIATTRRAYSLSRAQEPVRDHADSTLLLALLSTQGWPSSCRKS
jgi:hypothetical protein